MHDEEQKWIIALLYAQWVLIEKHFLAWCRLITQQRVIVQEISEMSSSKASSTRSTRQAKIELKWKWRCFSAWTSKVEGRKQQLRKQQNATQYAICHRKRR